MTRCIQCFCIFIFCLAFSVSTKGVVPNLIVFSPAENMVSVKPLVLLKGKIENATKLYLNNEVISLNEEGRFYIKKKLINKDAYNYFVLTAEAADGTKTKLVRKVFYKTSDISQVDKLDNLEADVEKLDLVSRHPIIKVTSLEVNFKI